MLESLKDIGFVYLINHGIPPDRIAQMFELVGANVIVATGITNPHSPRRFSHNPSKSNNLPRIHLLERIIEVSALGMAGIARVSSMSKDTPLLDKKKSSSMCISLTR
jgi:hypothetical protein